MCMHMRVRLICSGRVLSSDAGLLLHLPECLRFASAVYLAHVVVYYHVC